MINATGNSYSNPNVSVISNTDYAIQVTVQLKQSNSNIAVNDTLTLSGGPSILSSLSLNVIDVQANAYGDIVTVNAGTETITVTNYGNVYTFSIPQINNFIGEPGDNSGNLSLLTAAFANASLQDTQIYSVSSQTLTASISNFSFPASAVITGLQVTFNANCSGAMPPQLFVSLNNGTQISGFTLAQTVQNYVAGGDFDLWGNKNWNPSSLANLAVDFKVVGYGNTSVFVNNLVATIYSCSSQSSDAIDVTNFGFSSNIANVTTPAGFVVTVNGYATLPTTLNAQLVYGGQTLGTVETAMLSGNTTLVFGGQNDLIDSVITANMILDPTFGVRFTANSPFNSNIFLDAATITPYLAYSRGNNINFGTSVSSSLDGKWMFVGSNNPSNIGSVAAYRYTTTQPYNYGNISNVIKQASGTKQIYLNNGRTPDNAYSLRVLLTDPVQNLTNQIMIPELEYTVADNVITFSAPVSTSATFNVQQLENYYNYVTSFSDNNNASSFGTDLSCNEDGSSIVVGAPSIGTVYVYSRLLEKAYIPNSQIFYQRQTTTGNVVAVLVNGEELSKSAYVALPNSQYINFINPLPTDCSLQIEYDQFVEQQMLSSAAQTQFGNSVALRNNMLVIGSPEATNIVGSTTLLRQGAANFYVLDTSSTNIKTVSVSKLNIAAGITFYVNNYPVTTIDSTPESLVSVINQTTVYTGVMASYNVSFNTINLYINPALHINGIVGSNPALAALYSIYSLFQELAPSDISQSMFGENINWLAPDMFALQVNTGATLVDSAQAGFVDNVDFDSGTANFYDEAESTTSQSLIIYQVLTTQRSWVSNYADVIQVVPVRVIQISDLAGNNLFYDGNIKNLWVGNQSSPTQSLILYNNQPLYHGWTLNNNENIALEPRSISAAWIYDANTNTKLADLELVDLATGVLPVSIEQNLDYVADLDPAYYGTPLWKPGSYNIGDRVVFNNKIYQALVVITPIDIYFNINNWQLVSDSDVSVTRGATIWGALQVGQTWFDTSKTKTIDSQLGTVADRSSNWNTWFPGTSIVVKEWISSSVPPFQYVSSDTTGYATGAAPYVFDINGGLYYFWVANKTTAGAKYSTNTADIAASLTNLPNTGIAMISPIDTNRVAVWNVAQYVVGYNAVLHVDYVTENSNADLHSEFLLLSNNGEKAWLNTPIYNKFVDSLTGQTTTGAVVPAIGLLYDQQYGTTSNPARTIFANRSAALRNYFTQVNALLGNIAAATTTIVNNLSAVDPIPTSGFSETVPDRATLNSLDITSYPGNYRVLVLSDNTLRNSCWSIVSKTINNSWAVVNHQAYNLPALWTYTDWQNSNAVSNISTIQPTYTINNPSEFESVTLNLGDTLGILNNSNSGEYAIYQNNAGNISRITDLDLMYLQNGTIQFLPGLYDFENSNIGFDETPFDQIRYFDDDPATELRLITNSLNREILVGDLNLLADSAFFTALNYIILENKNLDWLFKTSFVTVDYNVKNLDQQQYYTATDDSTMREFITETLPYHTRVREFTDVYTGTDLGNITVADFDIPAIYDQLYVDDSQGVYNGISPVRSPDGSQVTDAERLTQDVYQNWNNNFGYAIGNIAVIGGGANYSTTPQIIITGGGGSNANAVAIIDPVAQKIIEIVVTNPGSGYTSQPTVTALATNNNTITANLYARLSNTVTRKATTAIRFDRIGYGIDTFDPTTYTGNSYGYPANSVVYSSNLSAFYVAVTNNPTGNLAIGNTTGWDLATNKEISETTALNRIYQLYSGGNSRPANIPRLLMSGLTYPDSRVCDFAFVQDYVTNVTGEIYNVDDINRGLTVMNVNFDPAEVNNTLFNSQVSKFSGYCGAFSRFSNQYIELDTVNSPDVAQLVLGTSDFTLEFWTRFTSTEVEVTSSDNATLYQPAEMMMLDMRTNTNTNGLYVYKTTSNQLAVGVGQPSTPLLISGLQNVNITPNAWQSIVIQRVGSTITLYLDGNQVASNSLIGELSFTADGLTFGADYTGQNILNGFMSDIRLTVGLVRYPSDSVTVPLQTEPFTQSTQSDPYYKYTKVLYEFSGLVNAAASELVFKSVNGQYTINDLSWNAKQVYLVNYINGQLVINNTPMGLTGTELGEVLTANLVNNLGYSNVASAWSIGGISTINSNILLDVQLVSSSYLPSIKISDSILFANTGTPLDGNSFVVTQIVGNIVTLSGGAEFAQIGFGQIAISNVVVYSNEIISNIANGAAQITTVNNLYATTGYAIDGNLNIVASSQTLTTNILGLSSIPVNANITGISVNFNSYYSGTLANVGVSLGQASNVYYPAITTSNVAYSYGSNLNTWGFNGWTANTVANLVVNFTASGIKNTTVYVNGLTANVYYTLPRVAQTTSSNLIVATSIGSGTAWGNLIYANSTVNFTNVAIVNYNTVYNSSNTYPQILTANVINANASATNSVVMVFPSQTIASNSAVIYADFSIGISNTVPSLSMLTFGYSVNNGNLFTTVSPSWFSNVSNFIATIPITGISGSNLANVQLKVSALSSTTSTGNATLVATLANVFVIPGTLVLSNSQTLSANITGLGNTNVFVSSGTTISNVAVTGVDLNFNAYYVGANPNITVGFNVGNLSVNPVITTVPTNYTLGSNSNLWGYSNWSSNTFANLAANINATSSGLSTVYVNNLSGTVYYSYLQTSNGNVITANVAATSIGVGNLVGWVNPQFANSAISFATANIFTTSTSNVSGNLVGTVSNSVIGGSVSATETLPGSGTVSNTVTAISPAPTVSTLITGFGTGPVTNGNANILITLGGTYSGGITNGVGSDYIYVYNEGGDLPVSDATIGVTAEWSINGGNTWVGIGSLVILDADSLASAPNGYPNGSFAGNVVIPTGTIPVTGITDLSLLQVKLFVSGSATALAGYNTIYFQEPTRRVTYGYVSNPSIGISASITNCICQTTQIITTPNDARTANLSITPSFGTSSNVLNQYVGIGVNFNAYYAGAAANLSCSINNTSANIITLTPVNTNYTVGGNTNLWGYAGPLTVYGLNSLLANIVASTASSSVTTVYVDNVSVTGYYSNQASVVSTLTSSNVLAISTGIGNVWINPSNVNSAVSYTDVVLYSASSGFGNVIQTLSANVSALNTVPSNATITGITVSFNAYQTGSNIAPVVMSAAISGGTEVDTFIVPSTTPAAFSFGSSADLWGYNTWTPQSIANGNVIINFTASCVANANVYINNLVANVAYLIPGPNLTITSSNVAANLTGLGSAWANVSNVNSTVSYASVTFNPQIFTIVNVYPTSTTVSTSNVYATGNAYIQTIGDTALNLSTNDFTVEFWYEPASNSNVQTLFEVSLAQSNLQQTFSQTRFVTNFSNNAIQVVGSQLLNPSNVWLDLNSGNLTLNTPYFISVERQANIFYLYVDGVLQSSSGNVFSNANVVGYSIPPATATQINGSNILQVINTTNAAAVMTFGAAYNGTNPATGVFGDIRVTNGTARHVIGPNSNAISSISSFFTDANLGVDSLGVTIDGGGFIDSISSYAPEEQVPGRIFDTLNIQVYQKAVANVASLSLGFGLFKNTLTQGPFTGYTSTVNANTGSTISVPWPSLSADSAVVTINGNMQTDANFSCSNYRLTFVTAPSVGANISIIPTGLVNYFSLGNTAITTLSSNLGSLDAVIQLESAAGFITPTNSNVGVILIGGERITYQCISYSGNVLAELARGTNGTGIANNYPAGTRVISIGSDRVLPGDAGGYTWYSHGNGTPSNGQGLSNSNSNIATFLISQGTIPPLV